MSCPAGDEENCPAIGNGTGPALNGTNNTSAEVSTAANSNAAENGWADMFSTAVPAGSAAAGSGGFGAEVMIPLYSVIFVLSVVGNILVIVTLTQNRRMRSVTNVFLLNLVSFIGLFLKIKNKNLRSPYSDHPWHYQFRAERSAKKTKRNKKKLSGSWNDNHGQFKGKTNESDLFWIFSLKREKRNKRRGWNHQLVMSVKRHHPYLCLF